MKENWKLLAAVFVVGILIIAFVAIEGLFIIGALGGAVNWLVPIGFALIFLVFAGCVVVIGIWWWRKRKEKPAVRPRIVQEEQPAIEIGWNWGWFKSKWPVFAALVVSVILWLVLRLIYGVIEWTAGNWGWDVNILSRFLFSVEVAVPAAAIFFAVRVMNMIIGTVATERTHSYEEVPWGEIVKFLWWKTLLVFIGGFLLTLVSGWQVEIFALLAGWTFGLALWYVEANRTKGGGI